jgi:DNA replication protein DnaC
VSMMMSQPASRESAGEMFSNVSYRREIDRGDLERMKVPPRYWGSTFSRLTCNGGDESLRSIVGKYIRNMTEMRRAGAGFIFWGKNGTGKSCASVVVAKEYRRRGNTVLFMEASDLKRMVIDKEYFDEEETFWDRARGVDVLVIDDFGKGVMDSTGFGATIFDELIRARNSRKLVTIITSNLSNSRWERELELKASTIHSLKECMIPVQVVGADQRRDSESRLRKLLSN